MLAGWAAIASHLPKQRRSNFSGFVGLSVAGPVVGTLKKMAGDALTETFTDADTFGIQFPSGPQFPQGCPTDHKALLLGCVFLIDMMFFEKENEDQGVI